MPVRTGLNTAIPSQIGGFESARSTRSGKAGRSDSVQPPPSQEQASITPRPEAVIVDSSEPPITLESARKAAIGIIRGRMTRKRQDQTRQQAATDDSSNGESKIPGNETTPMIKQPGTSLNRDRDCLLMPPPVIPSKATKMGAKASSRTKKSSADPTTQGTERPSTKKPRAESSNAQPSQAAQSNPATSSASSIIYELADTSSAHIASTSNSSVAGTIPAEPAPLDPTGSKRKRTDEDGQASEQAAKAPRRVVKKPRNVQPKAVSDTPADAAPTAPDLQQP
ncbi:MAG: hypothetical protein Q9174_003282, partial [Haloplaca sp. 1 TL-2023]